MRRLAAAVLCLAFEPRPARAEPGPPRLDWAQQRELKLDWRQVRLLELEIQPYVDLLQRYGKGGREAAAYEIATWSSSQVKDQLQPFMGLAKWVPSWDPAGSRVRAALMLHTDAAELLRRYRHSPTLQEDAARSLAREFAQDPRLRPFIERWFLALACDAQARTYWLDALAWARRGLESFDESVELRLVAASVEEVLASRAAGPVPDAVFDGLAGGVQQKPEALNRTSRDHLERARRVLLEAATRQPQRTDVQLRLGRVEWRLGSFADAHRTFEALLAAVPRGEAYLAHLFYGQLLEDENELEAAAREYSLAIVLDPQCQAARLALSHAGLLLGEAADARSDVELALASSGQRRAQDAFWQYHWGPSARFRGSLAVLRAEVAP